MSTDPAQRLGELLAAPLEELLVALGSGIGRAQAELDRHSIDTQARILGDPLLAQYGLEANWYQIPTTELELKLAVELEAIEGPTTVGPPSLLDPSTEVIRPVPRMWVAPVNPRFQNQFNYDVHAATTVKLSVVTVPPPGPVAAATPVSTVEEVLAAARSGLFPADQARSPDERVTVNFNPGERAWYVVQTDDAQTPPRLRAFVKIDDATRRQLARSGGPS
jgi:hypothetical protein